MSETLRCDCGFQARADDEDGLVTEVRRHAWLAHRMPLTPADALRLIRFCRTAKQVARGQEVPP